MSLRDNFFVGSLTVLSELAQPPFGEAEHDEEDDGSNDPARSPQPPSDLECVAFALLKVYMFPRGEVRGGCCKQAFALITHHNQVITELRSLQARFDAGTGVEQIAQRVSNEIERVHGQHHGGGRKQHEMRRVKKMAAGV